MPLLNVPVPVPSVVFEFDVVGFADMLQQTPRDVTAAPPSDVIFPPLAAVDAVILVTVVVAEIAGAVLTTGGGFAGGGLLPLLQLFRINANIIAVKGKIQVKFFFFIIIIF